MNYPLLSEYKEAILWAEDNFEKMDMLRPVKDERGEPIMSSGNFAVVFKMEDIQTKKLYAVKCFLKEQTGRAESYQKIARELEFVNSSFLTSIKYLEKELYVSSQSTNETEFPILLMDWVEGVTLDNYLREHLHESYTLEMLSFQFSRLATWLLTQPFAHGDLKPDNILVRRDGTLVLVDYDGMYVPTMQGEKSRELGSPDFRHPLRTENDFNEHIDDFALATIALSLKAIALKPELLQEYGASDRLLFAASDYNDLPHCKTLSALQDLTASTELSTLLGLFLIAWSNKNLAQVSFRLFSLAKPEKEEEALSTEATEEELAEAWKDEYGVTYSKDGKKLLEAPSSPRYLTTYTIRQGTKVICDKAFESCSSLRNLNIPNSITHIGNYAFKGCSYLYSLNIPNSVTHIGINPFCYCRNLIIKCQSDKFKVIEETLYDKENKALIGYYGKEKAFNIPDSVTNIRDYAFYSCNSLQSINIPDTVTTIGVNPFIECRNLIIKCQSDKFEIVENALYDKKNNTLIGYYGKEKTFDIPNSVKTIGNYAFYVCSSLQSINIPNSVTHIGDKAFTGCHSLQSINIPNSVKTIGNYAFYLCSSLQNINIPNSVTHIGDKAFNGCHYLQSINIPNSVIHIGDETFIRCQSLQSINIPNSVTHIGNYAFEDCKSLQSIDIPNSVTHIGNGAFKSCGSLQNINIPNSVMSIGNNPFRRCRNLNIKCQSDKFEVIEDALYDKENKTLIGYYGEKETFYIPNSVTHIGNYAFEGYKSLQSINIPNSVISIGNGAFESYKSLQSINIPNSITHIGNYAFEDCKSLQSINIPNSVISIGNGAFWGCSSLQSINIPNTVMSIGNYVFEDCLSLQNINTPNSVIYIGDKAFCKCQSLQSINIPNSVISIGNRAFWGCSSLQTINIPNSVTNIEKEAFLNCLHLQSINIPRGSYDHFAKLLPSNKNKLREIDF